MADIGPMTPQELVAALADHATRMANVVTYDEAAQTAAQAMIDFLPMDSVVQVRLTTRGAILVGAHRGPLGDGLTRLPFSEIVPMEHLTTPGAVWQSDVDPDSDDPLQRALAAAGAKSVAIAGFNGLGRLRGLIVLASQREVRLSEDEIKTLELLSSLAVSVLRATMLVPSLRRHAATDPLTGLWHRGAFSEAMIGRRDSDRHALILVDIDHFKRCNDTRGHVESDRVLQSVAAAMSSVLRNTDSVFRLGGDEFAALVEVDNATAALEMGERMHAAVAASDAGVTVSVGVALGSCGEGEAELRARADGALYRVKHGGRDGVAIDRRVAGSDALGAAA